MATLAVKRQNATKAIQLFTPAQLTEHGFIVVDASFEPGPELTGGLFISKTLIRTKTDKEVPVPTDEHRMEVAKWMKLNGITHAQLAFVADIPIYLPDDTVGWKVWYWGWRPKPTLHPHLWQ